MRIHKEGYKTIAISFLAVAVVEALLVTISPRWTTAHWVVSVLLGVMWLFVVSFFRIPKRNPHGSDRVMMTPADGKVCTVEEVFEKEYLDCRCLMVSVFMNGTDVHNNCYPCDGTVEYVNFQRGNYFVASKPKSCDLNERCSIGIKMATGERILIRQVAGLMARRIVCYAQVGDLAKQNQEFGFIKFGSRVDLYLPLGTKVIPDFDRQLYNQFSPIAQTPVQQTLSQQSLSQQ